MPLRSIHPWDDGDYAEVWDGDKRTVVAPLNDRWSIGHDGMEVAYVGSVRLGIWPKQPSPTWSVAQWAADMPRCRPYQCKFAAGEYSDFYSQWGYGEQWHGLAGVVFGAADAANFHAAYVEVTEWPTGLYAALSQPHRGRFVVGTMSSGEWTERTSDDWELHGVWAGGAWPYGAVDGEFRVFHSGYTARVVCELYHDGYGYGTPGYQSVVLERTVAGLQQFGGTARRVGVLARSDADFWTPSNGFYRSLARAWVYPSTVNVPGVYPVIQAIKANGSVIPAATFLDGTGLEAFTENDAGAIILAAGTPYTMLGADRILIGTQAPPAPANPNLFWRSLMLGDIPGVFDPTERPLWRSLVEA